MNWYVAKIVFHIQVANGELQTQFEEQLRLIQSVAIDDAFMKARAIGKKEEYSLLNDKHQQVTWKFVDVTEIQPLDALTHGAELYSCISEHPEPEDYTNFIMRKAQSLQVKNEAFV